VSLVLVFGRDDPARVRFAISPLWETMTALRVLRHDLAPSTVSEHLTVLHHTGLITRRRHRHTVIYQQTPLGTELADGAQQTQPGESEPPTSGPAAARNM
jgi:DNA-binding HxlR family transcriptional regulator